MKMFSLLVLTACFGWTFAAPVKGSCHCFTSSNVSVRNAGLHTLIVVTASIGECYTFNGDIITKDGYTWYELQNVHGHHRAWVASNYLKLSSHSHCLDNSGDTSTHSGRFASGNVSQECLQCLCLQESGCKASGCYLDVITESCGYFQIKQDYWITCGSPGKSWKQCAEDLHCSSQCVQNYMKQYVSNVHCPMTCESFAREHNGGPTGCRHSSTLSYWHLVQTQLGCSNVH